MDISKVQEFDIVDYEFKREQFYPRNWTLILINGKGHRHKIKHFATKGEAIRHILNLVQVTT